MCRRKGARQYNRSASLLAIQHASYSCTAALCSPLCRKDHYVQFRPVQHSCGTCRNITFRLNLCIHLSKIRLRSGRNRPLNAEAGSDGTSETASKFGRHHLVAGYCRLASRLACCYATGSPLVRVPAGFSATQRRFTASLWWVEYLSRRPTPVKTLRPIFLPARPSLRPRWLRREQ